MERGADILVQFTYAKAAAQGMRKAYDLGWRPSLQIIASVATSIGGTLIPTGIQASKGIVTARWEKLPTDPATAKDLDVIEFLAFCGKYMPAFNAQDQTAVPAYINSFMITHVLRVCGGVLTRENILRQTTSLENVTAPLVLPGITFSTSPSNYHVYGALQLARFDGEKFVPLGDPISVGSAD